MPRDDANRVHPTLVNWNQLTAPDREKDQENVRLIPQVLALAGYRAVAGGDGTRQSAEAIFGLVRAQQLAMLVPEPIVAAQRARCAGAA